ncbi:MAG: threonine synthase [Acidobacteriaceae bacterium]|nr:threonine synthase [Acidobacteriaceae bacterium]
MSYLRCSVPTCAATLDLHARALACPRCGDLLEVVIDSVEFDPPALKSLWIERRSSYNPRDASGVWRFRELLPAGYGPTGVVTLAEGNTPVVPGQKTAGWVGLKHLWFKHLGWNPTGSFKDLGMTAAMTEALFVGAKIVACASTGNTAASLAAYAARAGITGRVYLPAGQASNNKLAQALDFGAEIVQIQGSFDDALNRLLETSDPDLYFLNSINPFRVEGQKTAIFELLEQFGWRPPDYLFVPGGNLGNSSAFGKAFEELRRFGLVDRVPRMIIVQARGANPLVRMWSSGEPHLTPIAHPETIATAIRIGNPRSWKKALRGVETTGGFVMDVTDEEIGEAKTLIGRDGIGCEPASATTLAGIRKLTASGQLDRDASVAAILTGHALKDTDYIMQAHQERTRGEHAIEVEPDYLPTG